MAADTLAHATNSGLNEFETAWTNAENMERYPVLKVTIVPATRLTPEAVPSQSHLETVARLPQLDSAPETVRLTLLPLRDPAVVAAADENMRVFRETFSKEFPTSALETNLAQPDDLTAEFTNASDLKFQFLPRNECDARWFSEGLNKFNPRRSWRGALRAGLNYQKESDNSDAFAVAVRRALPVDEACAFPIKDWTEPLTVVVDRERGHRRYNYSGVELDALMNRLYEFLLCHDPNNVDLAGPLAENWVGRVKYLNSWLRSTYGRDLDGNSTTEVLIAFYRKHNRRKIKNADAIVRSWEADELRIFKELRRKYGVDPLGNKVKTLLNVFLTLMEYGTPQQTARRTRQLLKEFHYDERAINEHLLSVYEKDLLYAYSTLSD